MSTTRRLGTSTLTSTKRDTSIANPPPLLYYRPSLPFRILYFLALWAVKLISSFGFYIIRNFISPAPPEQLPTFIKSYSSRPNLKHRFFFPRSPSKTSQSDVGSDSSSSSSSNDTAQRASNEQDGQLYPLYLNIHGGGFALCDAEFDDEFCASFANRYSIAVISIDYSRTPAHRFPTALEDVVATAMNIVHDSSLPVDTARIVIGGFSAGGNLAIGVAQDSRIRDWFKGVVSWYPVTDMTIAPWQKQATRKYRGWWDGDDFKNWSPVWNWALFEEGQDMRDPRVGVRWSRREELPEWCCVVGAEYDMLCKEAKDMAESWVGGRTWDGEPVKGAGVADEKEDGWERDGGRTKWMLKRNVRHGFTHPFMAGFGAENQIVSKREYGIACEEIAEWLFRGAFRKETQE